MSPVEKYLYVLGQRAHSDWVSARLLWNLGFVAQAVWLIQQSMEKYLKLLWGQSKKFSSVQELKQQLRKLSQGKFDSQHDLTEVLNKLDSCVKNQLNRQGILIVKSDVLRYGGSFVYGGKLFSTAEKFIKKIRSLLKEVNKNSLYEEIKSTHGRVEPRTVSLRGKSDNIIKEILSLENKLSSRRLRRQIRRICN